MDSWVIARFQSFVNLFQHKPIWWIEQCSYVIGLGALGRFFYREEQNWWTVLSLIIDLYIITMAWRAGRSEAFAERVFGSGNGLMRCFFMCWSMFLVFLEGLTLALGATPSPLSICSDVAFIALTSCFYFAVCLPPPPPKTVNKLAFDGSNS